MLQLIKMKFLEKIKKFCTKSDKNIGRNKESTKTRAEYRRSKNVLLDLQNEGTTVFEVFQHRETFNTSQLYKYNGRKRKRRIFVQLPF